MPSNDYYDMKQILMVAEKPSIAEAIATALVGDKWTKRKGISPAVPVFEFEYEFPMVKYGREKCWIKITSTVGHVYKTDFPKDCQDWQRTEIPTLSGVSCCRGVGFGALLLSNLVWAPAPP